MARLTAAPFRGDHHTEVKWLWVEPSFRFSLLLRMIFSDLASPAEASTRVHSRYRGFAQAGNRQPPSDRCPRAGFFGIML
jgi:hypothetical protein